MLLIHSAVCVITISLPCTVTNRKKDKNSDVYVASQAVTESSHGASDLLQWLAIYLKPYLDCISSIYKFPLGYLDIMSILMAPLKPYL